MYTHDSCKLHHTPLVHLSSDTIKTLFSAPAQSGRSPPHPNPLTSFITSLPGTTPSPLHFPIQASLQILHVDRVWRMPGQGNAGIKRPQCMYATSTATLADISRLPTPRMSETFCASAPYAAASLGRFSLAPMGCMASGCVAWFL